MSSISNAVNGTNGTNGHGLNGGRSRVQEFLCAARGIDSSSFESDRDRLNALLAAYEVVAKLEAPWDTYIRLHLSQPLVLSAIRIFKDIRLMDKWNEHGNIPMTSEQLASLVGECDPHLLNRFLRLMAANGFLEQVPVGKFKPRQFLLELVNPDFNGLTDFYDTVLKKAYGHEGDLWSFLEKQPSIGEAFNIVQKASTNLEPAWMDMYPHRKMVEGSDPDLPLLVDVGGGIGHDLLRFYKLYPETASRLYLEDLPKVMADAKQKALIPDAINKVEYSFFSPQPVKHARAYYMHHIIHDWPDDLARTMLESQKSAMKPGYSRLLIHDQVLDNEKSQVTTTAFDIAMMAYLAGQERTEKQWLALLDSVGLKVLKFWKNLPDNFCVIEVEVPIV
ncbi:Demethylsterigmatocystin 6-O-methyltransferase 4 [Colletotrichum chlorophyti]|uniref:Demethylsterigmatocystin 6-O-methyltransferase 4 n=1 Tax=Colletotrichum chlorophyti TaxID=708187 RepID=A0A1Q8RMJ5_9PEZI|nr:Demethylsterigmatocystin 6-O-methyltransferase 4 [Colletotrichum chlorophyti]